MQFSITLERISLLYFPSVALSLFAIFTFQLFSADQLFDEMPQPPLNAFFVFNSFRCDHRRIKEERNNVVEAILGVLGGRADEVRLQALLKADEAYSWDLLRRWGFRVLDSLQASLRSQSYHAEGATVGGYWCFDGELVDRVACPAV
ncbi:hypothetical protein LINGRAHAP2_LOCUS28507 [Linum grandiflorum]